MPCSVQYAPQLPRRIVWTFTRLRQASSAHARILLHAQASGAVHLCGTRAGLLCGRMTLCWARVAFNALKRRKDGGDHRAAHLCCRLVSGCVHAAFSGDAATTEGAISLVCVPVRSLLFFHAGSLASGAAYARTAYSGARIHPHRRTHATPATVVCLPYELSVWTVTPLLQRGNSAAVYFNTRRFAPRCKLWTAEQYLARAGMVAASTPRTLLAPAMPRTRDTSPAGIPRRAGRCCRSPAGDVPACGFPHTAARHAWRRQSCLPRGAQLPLLSHYPTPLALTRRFTLCRCAPLVQTFLPPFTHPRLAFAALLLRAACFSGTSSATPPPACHLPHLLLLRAPARWLVRR